MEATYLIKTTKTSKPALSQKKREVVANISHMTSLVKDKHLV